jgi:transposase-like protein
MSNAFTAPHFHNHELAREWLERIRWINGPVCSHCGAVNHAYKTKKPGWYRCAEKECRKDFTVTTGTVMERSHIELNKWLMAFYLMSSSKKGVSAHQLHRALNLDYKSAWFMAHRIREAMRETDLGPLGGVSRRPTSRPSPRSCWRTSLVRADCIPTKAGSTRARRRSSSRTRPSTTPPRNTRGATFTRIAPKASFQSSSAA